MLPSHLTKNLVRFLFAEIINRRRVIGSFHFVLDRNTVDTDIPSGYRGHIYTFGYILEKTGIWPLYPLFIHSVTFSTTPLIHNFYPE